MFGACVANELAQVEAVAGGTILEFGGGTGALAATVLENLERLEHGPAEYLIVELNAARRAQQQDTIASRRPHGCDKIRWLSGLPETPVRGAILANEVLDALPVKVFNATAGIDP